MHLPQRVDPYECLRQRAVFEGTITSEQLPRLTPLLNAPSHDIQFRIAFDSDGGKRCMIDCSIKASLPLLCQRCGQEMNFPVESHSQLAVVTNDAQADELPEAYDPLLLPDGAPVVLLDVIEDELLLAIPMVPRHIDENCVTNCLS